MGGRGGQASDTQNHRPIKESRTHVETCPTLISREPSVGGILLFVLGQGVGDERVHSVVEPYVRAGRGDGRFREGIGTHDAIMRRIQNVRP
jgi:hypothetical protein